MVRRTIVSPGRPLKKKLRKQLFLFGDHMHLLYVDESGSVTDTRQRFFVLAGVSVWERDPHWIETELDEIANRFSRRAEESIELHGSHMRTGKGGWRSFPLVQREQAIIDALSLAVRQRYPKNVRLFAAVLEKQNHAGSDLAEIAFEQISSRFDQYLGRLHKSGNTQRGLIIFDKCSIEQRIQTLAREFKTGGHQFGRLRNFAEVPVFVDSEASRLIQLADLVSYAIFRHYEFGDSQFFNTISHCFDSEGGVVHGLYSR